MSDIKERLRHNIQNTLNMPLHKDLLDALAEIERLEAQNKRYELALRKIEHLNYNVAAQIQNANHMIAEEALKDNQ